MIDEIDPVPQCEAVNVNFTFEFFIDVLAGICDRRNGALNLRLNVHLLKVCGAASARCREPA